jgi:hypothetical protein
MSIIPIERNVPSLAALVLPGRGYTLFILPGALFVFEPLLVLLAVGHGGAFSADLGSTPRTRTRLFGQSRKGNSATFAVTEFAEIRQGEVLFIHHRFIYAC